jgi:hypothetical protein
MSFVEAARAAIQGPPRVKKDPDEVFLREFSRGPARQRIEEYLRDARDDGYRLQEDGIKRDNQSAITYSAGSIQFAEAMLKWLSRYDFPKSVGDG